MNSRKDLKFSLSRAYLDMSRANLKSSYFYKEKKIDLINIPNDNAIVSLISQNYIYAYMALTSIVNYHLYRMWEDDVNNFKSDHLEYKNIEHLMKSTDFSNLKDSIKKLCHYLQIPHLYKEEPELWQNLNDLLRDARHFFVHPTPETETVNKIITKVFEDNSLEFPSKIASNVMSYLFEKAGKKVPEWVLTSSDFEIQGYDIFGK